MRMKNMLTWDDFQAELEKKGKLDRRVFVASFGEEVWGVLRGLYEDASQSHLFEAWEEEGVSLEMIQGMVQQIMKLHSSYPGGLLKYVTRARELLLQSCQGLNPFDGWTPAVPTGVSLLYGSDEYVAMEMVGQHEVGKCCFVLVAGGLGERLGYSGIKVALPVETTSNVCYLEYYIRNILALQKRANAVAREVLSEEAETVLLPLVIMVSGDTEEKTTKLLVENHNFGMADGQITILCQQKVASFTNNQASLAIDGANKFQLLTKPHGHGDVHMLLHQSGLAQKWSDEGRRWVMFFQDTNALVFNDVVSLLGVSASHNFHMNSVAIRRKAKDAAGGLVRLTHSDGRDMTVNVEYNQLDPLLRSTINPLGDVNEADGFSCFPGNINQIILSLDGYVDTLNKTGGIVGEFVNPKYADEHQRLFKSPARLECMMQDYPQALPLKKAEAPSFNVGFTMYESWLVYSPCKNNVKDALKKYQGGVPPACASVAEHEYYACHSHRLRRLGANLDASKPRTWQGIEVATVGPKIVLDPSFATSFLELREKFRAPHSVLISAQSTLHIHGEKVFIHKLELDGALFIDAKSGVEVVIENLVVQNEGWKYVDVEEDASVSEVSAIRGYRLECIHEKRLVFDKPGKYVVNGNEIDYTAPQE